MKLAKTFFDEIRALIVSARTTVARGVDLVQVHTNFEIGRRIVEQEQKGKDRAAYGKEVIKALAERLTGEFGRGFSASNLAYMRSFYLLYQERAPIFQSTIGKSGETKNLQRLIAKSSKEEKRQKQHSKSPIAQTASGQLAAKEKNRSGPDRSPIAQSQIGQFSSPAAIHGKPFTLSWTHYLVLLGIKNPEERSFYEIEAASQGWKVRELKRQFDSSLYERLALSRDKKGIRKLAQEGQVVNHVQDLLKEPLVLEFLGLDEQTRFSESDLGNANLSSEWAPEWRAMRNAHGTPAPQGRNIKAQGNALGVNGHAAPSPERAAQTRGGLFRPCRAFTYFPFQYPCSALSGPKTVGTPAPSKEELQRKLVEWADAREAGDA